MSVVLSQGCLDIVTGMVCDHSNGLDLLWIFSKVRPKGVIGRDEDGPSEDRPKIRPKDAIGRDEDGPYEDCPKIRLKDVIGRDEDVTSVIRHC